MKALSVEQIMEHIDIGLCSDMTNGEVAEHIHNALPEVPTADEIASIIIIYSVGDIGGGGFTISRITDAIVAKFGGNNDHSIRKTTA